MTAQGPSWKLFGSLLTAPGVISRGLCGSYRGISVGLCTARPESPAAEPSCVIVLLLCFCWRC